MSKSTAKHERTYVLYQVDSNGLDMAAVAVKVTRTPEVELVNQGGSGLLVRGEASEVRKLTSNLDGWRAEANTAVR